jgi:L-alanine-DL-glutamate epimerase-like enolase superfamily enzyme
VELIEQPFPAGRLDWLADLQRRSPLPIVADESCVTIEDLDALVGVTAGVNVKLAKCGGLGPAARMLARARELGFRTFLGCMEETSVGIAASAAVASLADWVDLDGSLLLAEEPFIGLTLGDDHRWRLSDAPGLGVARR